MREGLKRTAGSEDPSEGGLMFEIEEQQSSEGTLSLFAHIARIRMDAPR
jgi:hypothetical protein